MEKEKNKEKLNEKIDNLEKAKDKSEVKETSMEFDKDKTNIKKEEEKNPKMEIEEEQNINIKEKKEGKKEEKKEEKKEDKKDEKKEIKKEKTLKELEEQIDYKYNESGELLHKTTGKKVQRLNFDEYEKVGKYVQKYVEDLLVNTFDLTILYVPNNKSSNFEIRDIEQAQSKILITKDFPTNPKCLMLIQGTGAVRLGQWARSVCINENLELGTMKPYIEKAKQNKFSVIIYNPNERKDFDTGEIIKEFSTMERHSVYVYNNIVKKNENIKEIYIVAHSMGGECTVRILLENKEDLLSGKIKKIAFTDSVHGESYEKLGPEGVKKFREISRNYIGSVEPVGKFVRDYTTSYGGVDCYSSGDRRHEYTSGTAINKVFEFFNSKEEKPGKSGKSDNSGKPSDNLGKPSDNSGKPSDNSGKTSDNSGKTSDNSGKPSDNLGN